MAEILQLMQSVTKDLQGEVTTDLTDLTDFMRVPLEMCSQPCLVFSKAGESNGSVLSEGDSTESSMAGSPLKLAEYFSSAVARSSKYKPCTIDEARKLLSVYQVKCQKKVAHPVLPVWVLCDGKDQQRTVAMSSHVTKKEADTFEFKSHVVTANDAKGESEARETVNCILKKLTAHLGRNKKVDVKSSATYNLFGSVSGKEISSSAIQIDATWPRHSTSLSPPAGAKGVARVTVCSGDERSAASSRFKELNILLELHRGLKKDEIHWPSEETDVSPVERVLQLLDDLRTGKATLAVEEGKGVESPARVALAYNKRKDLDFTEQVWLILKECRSNVDLVRCLKEIVNALKSGQIQPLVHGKNQCALAEMVRESFRGEITVPALERHEAVKILVDVGIEKLTRDYVSTFIGHDLVTLHSLKGFLTSSKQPTAERIDKLERLHYALELVILLDQFVNVPRPTLAKSARTALDYYLHNAPKSHEFVIPLDVDISSIVESLRPVKYEVKLKSYPNSASVHLGVEPALRGLSESDTEGNVENYYITTMTQSVIVL